MQIINESNYIIINGLKIINPSLVAKLQSADNQKSELIDSCLSLGFEVMEFSRHKGQADWLKHQVGQWFGRFGADFEDKVLKQNYEKLEKLLTEGSIQELQKVILEKIEDAKTELQMEKAIEGAIRETENQGPRKGFVFEDHVFKQLEVIAKARFDVVENVGVFPGVGVSKKGDFVYRCGLTNGRIVLELKDYSSSFSPQKIRETINESLVNRGAQFGIFLVSSEEALPDCFGSFFWENNYIVTTHQYLEVALKFALVDVYRQSQKARQSALDLEVLNSELSQCLDLLKTIDRISSGMKSAQKNIGRTSDDITALKEDLSLRIKRLLTLTNDNSKLEVENEKQ